MVAAQLAAARRQAALLPPSATEEELVAAEARLAPQAAEAARLTRAAGQHGPGTGILLTGLLHIVGVLRSICPEAFVPESKLTTSDLIKAHIQPITLPPGWIVEPEVTNAENSWYTHHYIDTKTGERRSQKPPSGTYSLCAKMAADPATASYISHAHTMSFLETLASIEAYVSRLAEEEVATMYWWIDGFVSSPSLPSAGPSSSEMTWLCFWLQVIDQHKCQYTPPSIDDNTAAWAEIFQVAVGKMGNVVMVLNPVRGPSTRTLCCL